MMRLPAISTICTPTCGMDQSQRNLRFVCNQLSFRKKLAPRLTNSLKQPTNQARFATFLLPLIVTVSLLYTSPIFLSVGHDREVFRYAATLTWLGYEPYSFVFDHKPPLLFILAAPFTAFGVWGFWIFFLLINLGVSGIAFLCFGRSWISLGSLIIFQLAFTHSALLENGGLTRQVTSLILLIAHLVAIQSSFATQSIREIRNRFFLVAILVSLIFWTQQNEAVAAFPALAGLFYMHMKTSLGEGASFRKGLISSVLLIATGAAIPTVLILVFFMSKGGAVAVNAMIHQAFVFNTEVYSSSKTPLLLYESTIKTFQRLHELMLGIPLALVAILAVYGMIVGQKRTRLGCGIFLLGLIAQVFATSVSGRHYGHYFLPFAVWIFLGMGTLNYAVALEASSMSVARTVVFSMLLFSSIVRDSGRMATHHLIDAIEKIKTHGFLSVANEYSAYELAIAPLRRAIDLKPGSFGELYIVGPPHLLGINADLRVPAPSKFVYHHFWGNPKFEGRFGEPSQILTSIQREETTYLVDCRHGELFINKQVDEELNSLIHSHYRVLTAGRDCNVLIREDQSQVPRMLIPLKIN